MEVILLEKIGKLGHFGDKVTVRDGYARNFLIPFKKALRVNKANLEMFESKKAELQKASDEAKALAITLQSKIKSKTFIVIRQAGDTGHLYGSVSTRDLSEVLKNSGVTVDYSKINIDTPIKEIGIYEVKVALHPEVIETIKVNVARSEEEAKVAEAKAIADAKKALEEKSKKETKASEASNEKNATVKEEVSDSENSEVKEDKFKTSNIEIEKETSDKKEDK